MAITGDHQRAAELGRDRGADVLGRAAAPPGPDAGEAQRILTIVAVPAGPDGSGYYRLYQPFKHLRLGSRHLILIPPPGQNPPPPSREDLEEVDVFIAQRPAGASGRQMWDRVAGATARVYEIDDDLLNVDPSGLPALCDERIASSVRYLLAASEMVTVSTPYLAEQYSAFNRNVVVLPNCVDERLLAHQRPRRDTVTVGYQGGTSHLADMCAVQEPLTRFFEAHRDTDMHFIGPDWSPMIRHDSLWTPWAEDVWEYYNAVDFDIGLAPLADIPFNYSKCVDSSMRISTNRGMLEAGSLEPGMKVWRDGWRKIEAAEKNAPRPGLLITTDGGYQLKLTAEHRMLVNGEWVQAAAIRPGDRIAMEAEEIGPAVPVQVPWPADSRMSRAGKKHTFDPQAFLSAADGPKLDITPRWGRILGAYVGDGSCGQSTQIQISCDGQDQDWIDLLMADFRAVGLNASTEDITQYDGTVMRRRGVRVASAHLLRVLEHLGLTRPRPNGRPIRVTRVPEVIWRSPREVIAEFLAGYFEADGHCTHTGVECTSKDEQLIRDVQRLLLGFGITSTVRARVYRAQNDFSGTYWKCSLRRAEADLFAKYIGFRSERKSQRLAQITGRPHSNAYRPITWSREVVSAEPCTVTPVDIQVEGSVFVLAGFVSHNSHIKALEYAALGIPVIATDLPPYSGFVRDGETGFLVPPGKPELWTRRLHELASDEAMRAEMGAKAREVSARYTIQGNWELWQDAYERAAGG